MKLLYFSLKGGVGKSSFALNHALEYKYAYVTNDIVTQTDIASMEKFYTIPHNTKRIPKELLMLQNAIFDFGAMSNVIDAKVTQAVKHCDCVVIPTLTDARSLQATIEAYNLIRSEAKSIVIIINNYQKNEKFEYARSVLNEALDQPIILQVKHTTLFERVARDGLSWLKKVGHAKGEHQLKITRKNHQNIYKTINTIAKEAHANYITNTR